MDFCGGARTAVLLILVMRFLCSSFPLCIRHHVSRHLLCSCKRARVTLRSYPQILELLSIANYINLWWYSLNLVKYSVGQSLIWRSQDNQVRDNCEAGQCYLTRSVCLSFAAAWFWPRSSHVSLLNHQHTLHYTHQYNLLVLMG